MATQFSRTAELDAERNVLSTSDSRVSEQSSHDAEVAQTAQQDAHVPSHVVDFGSATIQGGDCGKSTRNKPLYRRQRDSCRSRVFARQHELIRPTLLSHSHDRILTCEETLSDGRACGKSFFRPDHLIRHGKSHTAFSAPSCSRNVSKADRRLDQGQTTATLIAPVASGTSEKKLLTHAGSWSEQPEGTAYTDDDGYTGRLKHGCITDVEHHDFFFDEGALNGSRAPASSYPLAPLDPEEQAPNRAPYFTDLNEAAHPPNRGLSTATFVAPLTSGPYLHRCFPPSLLSVRNGNTAPDHLIDPIFPGGSSLDPFAAYPQDEAIVKHFGTNLYPTTIDTLDEALTQTHVSGNAVVGYNANDSGSGTVASSPSMQTGDIIIDNETSEESHLVAYDLSGNADDLLLSSRPSTAIFNEAQLRLERLLLDLQFLDDDTENDLSVASGDDLDSCNSTLELSSESLGVEDVCDEGESEPCRGEEENHDGNRKASKSVQPETGTAKQEYDGSSRKRQRIDSDDEDRTRAILKTEQKKPGSQKEQMLICCFRGDSQGPCLGTDKSICGVIERLATSHHIFICNRCYLLLTESDSGGTVHPDGVGCFEHCLSPRCAGDPSTNVGQRHLFNARSCGTKTRRPRPEDRESIFRYIFNLVHPTEKVPADVFTTGRAPHLGMKPRQRRQGPTRDELFTQAQELVEQFEELRKRDAAKEIKIDVLTRDAEKKQTKITHLEGQVVRLQNIIADMLQPVALSDEHWHRSIRKRVESDAPGALDDASAPSQHLQTPPRSLPGSRDPSTMPPPNQTGTTGQHRPSQDASLQLRAIPPDPDIFTLPDDPYFYSDRNDATTVSLSKTLGSIPSEQTRDDTNSWLPALPPHAYVYDATTNSPSGPTIGTVTESDIQPDIQGLDCQSRRETQSYGGGYPWYPDDMQYDADTFPLSGSLQDQALAEVNWDDFSCGPLW
jgi:hypothetical protein